MTVPSDEEKNRLYEEAIKKLVADFGDPIAEMIDGSYGKYDLPANVHSLAAVQALMFIAVALGSFAGLKKEHINEAYLSSWKIHEALAQDAAIKLESDRKPTVDGVESY